MEQLELIVALPAGCHCELLGTDARASAIFVNRKLGLSKPIVATLLAAAPNTATVAAVRSRQRRTENVSVVN
jgi:hypothetical protein